MRLLASVLLVLLAFARPVEAQPYPSRTITIVVPFAPGGLTDIPARVLAALLQERMGVSVVVENKAGASGVVGASHVLRAEPDGYTLLANALADVQNLHYISVPYNAITDFSLIGKVVDGPPMVLIIHGGLPFRSLADLIAAAKADPTKVSFGTSGPASSPVIALAQLNALAGTRIVDVPYRGSGQAAAAVATGEVQGTFTFYSSAKPLTEDGKARALAVASPQRIASWPEIPTMAELGFPGFDHRGFVGLAAPARTPPQIIATLNRHLNDVIASDAFRQRLEPLGMTVPTGNNTPDAFAQFMREATARQGELAKLSGHDPAAPRR